MKKSLVIVESPAKAKTINKYLGRQYIVRSSVGHIRDLPVSGKSNKKVDIKARVKAAAYTRTLSPKEKEKHKRAQAKKQLIARMGIDPENNWKAHYEILPGKEKVVEALKKLSQESDFIYLATDLDREGEAIAWHLQEAIGGDKGRYRRVVFNEITKQAIAEAFETPTDLKMSRVQSQQTRRYLDRVVGFMVSPLLWAKVARGLSAGRVQSVAVRLIVEREREIRAFVPQEFWEVFADLETEQKEQVRFQVVKAKGKNFRPSNQKQTHKALESLQKAHYEVSKREDRPTKTWPAPPFITSTLQQAASTRLGFSIKKTMMLAQRLYEAGHITYMRTDSTNLSKQVVGSCRAFTLSNYGEKYLPGKPNVYASKKQAQEAHEAIRPSDPNARSVSIPALGQDVERLYDLIWCRFTASQMTPAEFTSTSVSVKAADFELRTKGRIMRFDGHTRVLPPLSKSDEDTLLPDLKEGDVLNLLKLDPSQHFTKPPPRYTEASLVKELEKRSIGRPSTYVSIISTIQERGYVKLENRRFYANKIGEIVTDRLMNNFNNFMDYGFTAEMETSLDDIANGKSQWKKVLNQFYKNLVQKLEKAQGQDSEAMQANDPVTIDIPCSVCGRNMQTRVGSTGVFLGCSGYALTPKERCKNTINLIPEDEIAPPDDEGAEGRLLAKKKRCPLCKSAMDAFLIDEERKLHLCGRNPDCLGFEIERGRFKIKGYEGPVLDCDKCASEMQLKVGRFGKYFDCTNADCSNKRKLLRNGEVAPPKMDVIPMPQLKCQKCDDHYLLRDGASGLFLAASQFPKHREIRAPLVEELLEIKDKLDPKYQHLVNAPLEDGDGNKSMVRWQRRTKEQYVMTEKNKKATGWKAFYRNGLWREEKPKAKRRMKKSK